MGRNRDSAAFETKSYYPVGVFLCTFLNFFANADYMIQEIKGRRCIQCGCADPNKCSF